MTLDFDEEMKKVVGPGHWYVFGWRKPNTVSTCKAVILTHGTVEQPEAFMTAFNTLKTCVQRAGGRYIVEADLSQDAEQTNHLYTISEWQSVNAANVS